MTTLRQLGAVYCVAASAFATTIVLAHHPDWAAATRTAAHQAGKDAVMAAARVQTQVLLPGWAALRQQSGQTYETVVAAIHPKPQAEPDFVPRPARPIAPLPAQRLAKVAPPAALPVPGLRIAPALRPQIVPSMPAPVMAAKAPRTRVTLDIAPPPKDKPVPPDRAPDPAELAQLQQRLKDDLSPALYQNFDLFLFVSKADKGPLAQRMYVFAKASSGDLALRYDWPVSTGREKVEYNKAGWKLRSFTPAGYYELDPHRMYRHYRSVQWSQSMPYAMFFNWVHDGNQTGLAIHAADSKDIALLGQRASGGCVHLAPQNARVLFDLIRTRYKGPVPRFAYDRKTHSMSNRGALMRDAKGDLRLVPGYKVLVVIENYGGADVVAALM